MGCCVTYGDFTCCTTAPAPGLDLFSLLLCPLPGFLKVNCSWRGPWPAATVQTGLAHIPRAALQPTGAGTRVHRPRALQSLPKDNRSQEPRGWERMPSLQILASLGSISLLGCVTGVAVAVVVIILLLATCLFPRGRDWDVERSLRSGTHSRRVQPRLFPGRGHLRTFHQHHSAGHVSHTPSAGFHHHYRGQHHHQAHGGRR